MKTDPNTWTHWKKQLINEIKKLGMRHGISEVFDDLVTMIALTISNTSTGIDFDKREKQYLDIINKYATEEQKQFATMFAYLVKSMNYSLPEYRDILGEIYEELSMNSKDLSQFFTPRHVALLMAKITGADSSGEIIKENGFVTLCEPTCGSGVLVLAYAEMLANNKYNPSAHMCVTAIDLSLKCVFMTYVQLSYYGIPAVVIHGNGLTFEEHSRWYTPAYLLGNWACKCNSQVDGKN